MAHEVRANTSFASRWRGGREFPANEWVAVTDADWKGELGAAIRGDAAFEHRAVKAAKSNPASQDTPPAPEPEKVNLTPHDPDPSKSQEALPK